MEGMESQENLAKRGAGQRREQETSQCRRTPAHSRQAVFRATLRLSAASAKCLHHDRRESPNRQSEVAINIEENFGEIDRVPDQDLGPTGDAENINGPTTLNTSNSTDLCTERSTDGHKTRIDHGSEMSTSEKCGKQ